MVDSHPKFNSLILPSFNCENPMCFSTSMNLNQPFLQLTSRMLSSGGMVPISVSPKRMLLTGVSDGSWMNCTSGSWATDLHSKIPTVTSTQAIDLPSTPNTLLCAKRRYLELSVPHASLALFVLHDLVLLEKTNMGGLCLIREGASSRRSTTKQWSSPHDKTPMLLDRL